MTGDSKSRLLGAEIKSFGGMQHIYVYNYTWNLQFSVVLPLISFTTIFLIEKCFDFFYYPDVFKTTITPIY